MKSNIIKSFAALLTLSFLIVGCKKDREDAEVNVTTEESAYDESGQAGDEATATQDANGNYSTDGSASQERGAGSNNATGSGQNSTAKGNKSTYSAADGTNDENNDGDMYTKNDTTRMPSGSTSIK